MKIALRRWYWRYIGCPLRGYHIAALHFGQNDDFTCWFCKKEWHSS